MLYNKSRLYRDFVFYLCYNILRISQKLIIEDLLCERGVLMIFSKKYYVGETVKNKSRVIKRLSRNRPYKNIYCICLGNSPKHLMYIIESREMFKPVYSNNEYKVIGIANGKYEAFELTRLIIESVYREYGNPVKIKEFFALE